MKVVVTGASGLLVVGTAFSRTKGDLAKLDLTDAAAVERFLKEQKPDVLVHCAAERRPDVAERDRDAVLRLNVETPRDLGKICKETGIMLIYISTDYVFDGNSPPYEVEDKPNPLNFYGQTKLDGEEAIKSVYPEAVILRVPILYGNTEYNGESAINVLIDVVLHDKPADVDNVASRYPTNVEDVGRVLKDLAAAKIENHKDIKGIYHFSGKERVTKYQVCEIIGDILDAPINHLTPQNTVDKAASVSRPEDSHLSNKRLQENGIDINCVKLATWFSENLGPRD
ncbi:RmlD-like substrate binding domain-containing protein [Parasitella parasitica]|nr:RmlD-like substrate binding domain-containing protein [Parasitella parasitica]